MDDNDMPEGMARLQALEAAMQTSTAGENPINILNRASLYYAFLTSRRPHGAEDAAMGKAN